MRCMTAIWPVGPPKLSMAIRSQTRNASPSEIPCFRGGAEASAINDDSITLSSSAESGCHGDRSADTHQPPAIACCDRVLLVFRKPGLLHRVRQQPAKGTVSGD